MIKPTPWVDRKFEFHFPVGIFPIIIERLRGTLTRLEAILQNIPEEKLSNKLDGKWSVKEVIGHLFDLEELWQGRIDDFLRHKETLRAADMTNAKTNEAHHNAQSLTSLLKKFREAREALIKRVENFDEAMASITSLHPRLKTPMRMVDSLFFTAEHDDHELTKIRNLIKS
jgi:uncharacterized damage-inducible protein DinB